MDKEEMAMSQRSTLASSENTKVNSPDEQGQFLNKRECDFNNEFEQLIRSASESESDETDRKHQKEQNRPDIKEDIGISKKRLIRNRQSFAEKCTPDQKENRCSNNNCNVVFKKEACRLYKTKYLNETALYCEDCNTSIRKKWTCLFCKAIYTEPTHSANNDNDVWINCENKKCRRWTHLGCEGSHRMQDLNAVINNENYKFYCSECNDHLKTPENIVPLRKPVEPPVQKPVMQQVLPSQEDFKEFRQAMTINNRFDQFTNTPYFYLYSETYQPIGKLLAEKQKTLTVPAQEFARDCAKCGLELSAETLEQLMVSQKKGSDMSLYRKNHYRMAAADHK
jgi:hypothetical protein